MTKNLYILVDPIGRSDSGVSSYSKAAAIRIAHLGLEPYIFIRRDWESIEEFRLRLANAVRNNEQKLVCVEAPETLAASSLIPSTVSLHIRLHCSRGLGAYIQGDTFNWRDVELEQAELDRASLVTAPSQATIVASNLIFRVPSSTVVYPNPMPEFARLAGRCEYEFEVLFVGRAQYLKGFHWLVQLANIMPDIRFAAAIPTSSIRNTLPPNLKVIDGLGTSKSVFYSSTRIVVIPSVFETASMVGLEALSMGKPIITWKHIGIAEYLSRPHIITVPYRDISVMATMVRTLLAETQSLAVPTHINDHFDNAVLSLLAGRGSKYSLLPPDPSTETIIARIPDQSLTDPMKNTTVTPRFIRKLKKLRRDPKGFFCDSLLGHLLIRPGAMVDKPKTPPKRTGKTTLQNAVRDGKCADSTHAPISKPQSPPKNTEKKAFSPSAGNAVQPANAVQALPRFVDIGIRGRIEFQEPLEKPVGVVTALLYSMEAAGSNVQELLNGLDGFSDFRYVGKERLHVGRFNPSLDGGARDVLDRIDLQNKKRLAKISNLILIDACADLCTALRSCGTDIRTILVLTKTAPIDALNVDVLITIGDAALQSEVIVRRRIHADDRKALPIVIRRVIQEGAPKRPDMLLPLIGCKDLRREEFFKLDSRYHQGIIGVRPGKLKKTSYISDIYADIAHRISYMAVMESLYMRYRSLCEAVEGGHSAEALLDYCLRDGIIFRIENHHA